MSHLSPLVRVEVKVESLIEGERVLRPGGCGTEVDHTAEEHPACQVPGQLAAKLRVPMRDRRLCLVHVRQRDHRLKDVLMLASQSGVRCASRAVIGVP